MIFNNEFDGKITLAGYTISEKLTSFYEKTIKHINVKVEPLELADTTGLRAGCDIDNYPIVKIGLNLNGEKYRIKESLFEQTVAHEIMHAVLWYEGFPEVKALNDQYVRYRGIIISDFQDPVINKRLVAEGFNSEEKIRIETNDTLEGLAESHKNQIPLVKFPKIQKFILSLIYLYHYLELKYTIEDEGVWKLFKQRFRYVYPKLCIFLDAIEETINTIGYETPEKMINLMKKILNIFRLDDDFKVITRC
ncbi:MAG: hypothetical protein JW983_03440 [Elusimicrobia bacterium]|nr:hypothetical protein [Elusimicrobiota bacterium]